MPMHLLQNLVRLEKSLRANKREHATFHCTFLAGHHTLTASNIRLNYLEEYVLPIQCCSNYNYCSYKRVFSVVFLEPKTGDTPRHSNAQLLLQGIALQWKERQNHKSRQLSANFVRLHFKHDRKKNVSVTYSKHIQHYDSPRCILQLYSFHVVGNILVC